MPGSQHSQFLLLKRFAALAAETFYYGWKPWWLQPKHTPRGELRSNEGKRVLRKCRTTWCSQRMRNMTSQQSRGGISRGLRPSWHIIWVTPATPRTNGPRLSWTRGSCVENSLCCLGRARGQTFTSSSDKNARLRQNTHMQDTESLLVFNLFSSNQSKLCLKVLITFHWLGRRNWSIFEYYWNRADNLCHTWTHLLSFPSPCCFCQRMTVAATHVSWFSHNKSWSSGSIIQKILDSSKRVATPKK